MSCMWLENLFFAISKVFSVCIGKPWLESTIENSLSALPWGSKKEPYDRIAQNGHNLLERAHFCKHMTSETRQYDSWTNAIHSYMFAIESFCQFVGKKYITKLRTLIA